MWRLNCLVVPPPPEVLLTGGLVPQGKGLSPGPFLHYPSQRQCPPCKRSQPLLETLPHVGPRLFVYSLGKGRWLWMDLFPVANPRLTMTLTLQTTGRSRKLTKILLL